MTERTCVIIKPDGVSRNLTGEIISRFEKSGLRLVALKMIVPGRDLVCRHYPDSMAPVLGQKSKDAGEKVDNVAEFGKKVLEWLRTFISSGPVVPMVFEGKNAVKKVREITGYTDPVSAVKGTIRGDLGEDSILRANKEHRPVKNLLHASGSIEEAKHEIKLWFKDTELVG